MKYVFNIMISSQKFIKLLLLKSYIYIPAEIVFSLLNPYSCYNPELRKVLQKQMEFNLKNTITYTTL